MDIAISEHIVRVVVITLGGRVDAFNSPTLRAEADRLLAEGVTHFVIDLSAVPFMDSAGMAVLVSVLKGARQGGGDVKLVWPAAEGAQRILRLTKFDRVFEIFDETQLAVKAF